MSEPVTNQENEVGSVKISEEVVAIVAGLAATDIPGVAGMANSISGGLSELLGKKSLSKGVKVELLETEAIIDLFIIA